jgi:hypothetical protein
MSERNTAPMLIGQFAPASALPRRGNVSGGAADAHGRSRRRLFSEGGVDDTIFTKTAEANAARV